MSIFVRAYPSQKAARDAAKKLQSGDIKYLEDDAVFIMTPKAGAKADAEADTAADAASSTDTDAISAQVAAAVDAGQMPQTHASIAAESLRKGHTVLTVDALFGQGIKVTEILDSCGPVKIDREPDEMVQSKFKSEEFGIPLLWNGKSIFANLFGGELSRSQFSFGSPRLKDNPAPFSSTVNMNTLSDNPTPLSSKFGKKVLLDQDKRWITGEPKLTSDPAPLSSKVGMKLLTEPKKDWDHGMGGPLLSSNPTPLSSLMGWKVLIK